MAKFTVEEEHNKRNTIGVGTEIKGDIESTGNIRIDGSLIGNIKTKGRVVIGGSGSIRGEIHCKDSEVEGKIEGKIVVQDLLSLKETSIIKGDIEARQLAIEAGAKFTGNCTMGGPNSSSNVISQPAAEESKKK